MLCVLYRQLYIKNMYVKKKLMLLYVLTIGVILEMGLR